MALLADYAITPDVFDVTSYQTEGECAARLETIREAMLTEGLVRDLRDGAWSGLFRGDARPWHRRGLELLKKMATQGRLLPVEPALPGRPADDRAWCAEAIATDGRRRFDGGVIATGVCKAGVCRRPAGRPYRPAVERAVVGVARPVSPAGPHRCRLREAPRSRAERDGQSCHDDSRAWM